MATVINNPNTDSGAGGWSIAIIALAIIVLSVLAFFVFGSEPAAPEAPAAVDTQVPAGTQ